MSQNKPYTEILNNATLAFVKVAESDKKYQSEDREYSLSVVVSKADAKAFKKKFPKQSVKDYENDEFKEKFKIDPPFHDQDEQYVLKLSKVHIKDGVEANPKYRPRVYLDDGKGNFTDITTSRLVANGSKGDVAYRVIENSFGVFAHLDVVRLTEFIEYKKWGAANPFGGRVVAVEEDNESATNARSSRNEQKETSVPPQPQPSSNTGFDPDNTDDRDLPF